MFRWNNTLPPLSDLLYPGKLSTPSFLTDTPSYTSPPPCYPTSDNNYGPSQPNTQSVTRSLKVKRKRASPSQLSVLNRVFSQTYFPSTELRIELGKQLGMSPRTVQIWFQNKRQSARMRDRSHHKKNLQKLDLSFPPPPLSPPMSPPALSYPLYSYPRATQAALPHPSSLFTTTKSEQISLPPLRVSIPLHTISPQFSSAQSSPEALHCYYY